MAETETLPPQADEKEWEGFARELRLARPWIMAMGVIDIVIGALSLPLGAGNIVIGAMLLLLESRLKRFLNGEANTLKVFASQLRLYFVISVIVFIATMVFYFIFVLLYVVLVILFAIILTLITTAGSTATQSLL